MLGLSIVFLISALPGLAETLPGDGPCRAPADEGTVSTSPLPGKVTRLFEQERLRIEDGLGPEKARRVIGPTEMVHRVDVDGDAEEPIRDDLYIARLDCRDVSDILYLFVFWNDYLILPGGKVQTGEWKVVTFPSQVHVVDVNGDGVDDYVGKLIVVPSVNKQPRTRFMRRAMISSPDEIGAYRPVRLVGEDAMAGSELPPLEP